MTIRLILLLLFVRCFASSVFAADTGSGIFNGQVSNQATGEFLEGANITVEGASISTTSERGGGFSLSLPTGNYTLIISYTGLTTKRLPIVVSPGQRPFETIALTSDIYKLEAFSVSGMREGNALAIQLQRQADNLKTVVSSDAFGSPANNPGELLQRLAGVNVDLLGGEATSFSVRGLNSTFASLMIDGNSMASSMGTSPASRDINIQQVGTNNIQSVELIKAPTPDMDANAIAGYVNMITKRSFDSPPERKIGLSVGTRWTKLRGGDIAKDTLGLDYISFSYSDVYSIFGGRNNLGVLFSASQRRTPNVTDESGPSSSFVASNAAFYLPAASGLSTPVMKGFGAGSLFWPDQKAQTVALNIDYKFSRDTYFYLKSSYYGVHVGENAAGSGYDRMFITAPAVPGSFAAGSNYTLQNANPTSTATLAIGHQKRQTNTPAASAGFESKFPDIRGKLNFDASYSLADSSYPILGLTRMATPATIGWRLERTENDAFNPTFTQTSGPSLSDPASYTPTTTFRQIYHAPNQKMAAHVDFKKDFFTEVPAYLKVGAKWSSDLHKQTNRVNYETYIGPSGVDPKYIAPLTTQGDGSYGPYPYLAAPYSGLSSDIMQNRTLWGKRTTDAYNSALYSDEGKALDGQTDERISSAYVIGNVRLNQLRILTGLRFEETDQQVEGYAKNQTASWGGSYIATLSDAENAARALHSILPKKTYASKYHNVFPGLHFVYEPLNGFMFRLSYNSTITRAPIGSLLPTITVNPDNLTVVSPNTSLKPYTADNFDFAVQKYFEPIGSLEFGVFTKQIKNYFRTVTTTVGAGADNGFNGEYEGYTWARTFNVGGARYRGFEFSYTQQYKNLPGFLSGLGAFANFTYLQAQGDFGSTTFQKTIPNERPRTANTGVSYTGYGLQTLLLANWQDRFYRSGAGNLSIYADPQLLMDLKTSYRINRNTQLYLDIFNLTNENVATFVQDGGLKVYSQRAGITVSTGVNMTF
jgi:TonB-dependent receptor